MGDFAGATLKYLRNHPAPRLTLAGGIGKLSKLAAGRLDLHSRAGEVDLDFLAALAPEAAGAGSAAEALLRAPALGEAVARRARETALAVASAVAIDVVIFDRAGRLVARAGP
jgi:cobalt-precorrin-5B (C1)-methyltransferase